MSGKYTVIFNDYELSVLSYVLSNQLRADESFLKEHDPAFFLDVERRRKCVGRLIYFFNHCGIRV